MKLLVLIVLMSVCPGLFAQVLATSNVWPRSPPRPSEPLPDLLFQWSTPSVKVLLTNDVGVVEHNVVGARTSVAVEHAIRNFLRSSRLDASDDAVSQWSSTKPAYCDVDVTPYGSRFRHFKYRFFLNEESAPVKRYGAWMLIDPLGEKIQGELLERGYDRSFLPPGATGVLVVQEETMRFLEDSTLGGSLLKARLENGEFHGLSHYWSIGDEGYLSEDEYVKGSRMASRIWLNERCDLFSDCGVVTIEENSGTVDGLRMFWARSGQLTRIQTFRDGYLHGLSLDLSNDGSIEKCFYFEQGNLLVSLGGVGITSPEKKNLGSGPNGANLSPEPRP